MTDRLTAKELLKRQPRIVDSDLSRHSDTPGTGPSAPERPAGPQPAPTDGKPTLPTPPHPTPTLTDARTATLDDYKALVDALVVALEEAITTQYAFDKLDELYLLAKARVYAANPLKPNPEYSDRQALRIKVYQDEACADLAEARSLAWVDYKRAAAGVEILRDRISAIRLRLQR